MVNPNTAPTGFLMSVYRACDVRVVEGPNLGDPLSCGDDLMLDDIYGIPRNAAPQNLTIDPGQNDRFTIGAYSETGAPGAPLHLDCSLALMTPDGRTSDALVLVETSPSGTIAEIYLLPFNPLLPRTPYALVRIDRDIAPIQLAQRACARFTRGTRITLASGQQRPIEDLRLGDRVLTRDDGPQPLRWIGMTTERATGDFAPICIRKGILNNTTDLLVSPDHRLFIYQRRDHLGAGRAELLVKARHLVNDDTVFVQEGGFVDYFQLLFDRHQIIYAEGISAESMLVDTRTKHALPPEVAETLTGTDKADRAHGLDVHEALLERPDAAELLRRASSR